MEGVYFLPLFFTTNLTLALEVNKGLFIDCLAFIVVNNIKKHLLELTQSNIGPYFCVKKISV